MTVERAILWLDQARSNARAAQTIAQRRHPMVEDDVGCHVALLCAQSFEKCIKGCMLLLGMDAPLSHDMANRIDVVLEQAAARGIKKGPEQNLAELFRARGVRRWMGALLSWTPGNAEPTEPNYEYPWPQGAEVEKPCGHALFEDEDDRDDWIEHARALSDGAMKIAEAMARPR